MSQNPSTSSGEHKPERSADFMESTDVGKMQSELEKINAQLSNHYMGVKALEPALETVQEILHTLEYIEDNRAKPRNADRVFGSISFSNLEERHLPRLGITEQPILLKEAAIQAIKIAIKEDTRFRPVVKFWEKNATNFCASLRLIEQTTSLITEAGGRILVDRIIQEVTAYILSTDGIPYIFPELRLSVSSAQPVEIRSSVTDKRDPSTKIHYSTFLTGSVDYFATVVNLSAGSVQKRKEFVKRIQTAGQSNTLDSLRAQRGPLQTVRYGDDSRSTLEHLQIVHIEAKRGKEHKKLRGHRAQSIGEALATMASLESSRGMWCLTTGKEWIFGLVMGDLRKENEERISYSMEALSIEFDLASFEAQVEDVFLALIFFMLGSHGAIDTFWKA